MNIRTGEHDYFVQTIVEMSIPFMLSESDLKRKFQHICQCLMTWILLQRRRGSIDQNLPLMLKDD